MTATKWFDRKFDFNFGMERYTSLYQRLHDAAPVYRNTVVSVPEDILQQKLEDKWSIKEHIGHLFVLEPLWRKRFQEIKEGAAQMSPADLANRATWEAGFNTVPVNDLLENFTNERKQTLDFLDTLKENDFSHSIVHPRLQKPMRIIDLMFFVAEHDQHHLNTIQSLLR